ncbi:hypothetical protein AAGG74_18105 [Bacillus mexicanus]|uniref:hypothetical protein n=1 Tax=Bacillus mexicanus TaxID=2834415 RepID=UPI003D23C699
MFYALMVIELILIGSSFFLWYQLNKEGIIISSEEEFAIPQKPIKRNKSRPVKKSKQFQESKRNGSKHKARDDEFEAENMDWEFGMVERDRGAYEEKKEMDDMFGFRPSPSKDELAKTSKPNESKKTSKNDSIDDIYGELFSDEEKESLDEFTPTINKDNEPIKNKQVNRDHNDFNESIFADDQKDNQDEFDFLNKYDFESNNEETLDDEIFERARKNKKNNFDDDSDLLFGDTEEDELDFAPNKREIKDNSKRSLIDAEDDEIFSRFESLKNKLEEK